MKIVVIGGGIAGSSVALYLSSLGLDVTLFEKSKSLVNGPPICHLHAGGNLYRDISDAQCVTLLKESIELIRMYPQAIDYRPTVIAIPLEDKGAVQDLIPRLKVLENEYKKLITQDTKNEVLGNPREYYRLFQREDIENLKNRQALHSPKNLDDWMIPIANNIDLDKVKFPLLLVQEYGINLFRLAASVTLSLENSHSVTVKTQTLVTSVMETGEKWNLTYTHNGVEEMKEFDYLINAAGFKSGEIDDMLGFQRERYVEFKAAYVTQCEAFNDTWPEVIFHGERGTPHGMSQFTPYPNGYFQLHGMTNDITLFKDGLVRSTKESAQPQLAKIFMRKIDKGWSEAEVVNRSAAAIQKMSRFIPVFNNAQIMSKPLYGAQQIPGEDSSLRAADVSFERENYARCEIVKASSVLNMADAITLKLIELGHLKKSDYKKRNFTMVQNLQEIEIQNLANYYSECRGYPISLAQRCFSEIK